MILTLTLPDLEASQLRPLVWQLVARRARRRSDGLPATAGPGARVADAEADRRAIEAHLEQVVLRELHLLLDAAHGDDPGYVPLPAGTLFWTKAAHGGYWTSGAFTIATVTGGGEPAHYELRHVHDYIGRGATFDEVADLAERHRPADGQIHPTLVLASSRPGRTTP